MLPITATLRIARWSLSLKNMPDDTGQSRIVWKSVDTPLTRVRQLPCALIACVPVNVTGDTAASRVDSRLSFSASCKVRRLKVPAPWLTPPCPLAPGMMKIMLVPRLLTCF